MPTLSSVMMHEKPLRVLVVMFFLLPLVYVRLLVLKMKIRITIGALERTMQ